MDEHRRRTTLTTAARKPRQRVVQTLIYELNLDVAAEVLDRVNEIRKLCQHEALFVVRTVVLFSKSTTKSVLSIAVMTLLITPSPYSQTVIDENILGNKTNRNLPRKVAATKPHEAGTCSPREA